MTAAHWACMVMSYGFAMTGGWACGKYADGESLILILIPSLVLGVIAWSGHV